MTSDELLAELGRYESELTAILGRFSHGRDGIHIARSDDPLLRQYTLELVDLLNDAVGPNGYSQQIVREFNEGISNFVGSPSFKSVENTISILKAARTRFARNPAILEQKRTQENLRRRQNVFIIHGRDEAKWRELKDIVSTEFSLNPIILADQPDAGCRTVIEKFEHYAQTCAYAIAVFTPDDEVHSGEGPYMQARPNVIYELGWFCGRLGRSGAMLLLKDGTSMFSDFGGIMQKRFTKNIAEITSEMRKDLVTAGILENV